MNINLDLLTPSALENIYNAMQKSIIESDDQSERAELLCSCDRISRAYENLTGEQLQ